MQTFVPYADFALSARVLDRQRLGKQRVEVLQILRALAGLTKGWVNHPAVKMWRDHETVLVSYGAQICFEWVRRGYKDTCLDKILDIYAEHFVDTAIPAYPPWVDGPIHDSHKAALYRKDPEHYAQFSHIPEQEYVWPV